MSTNQDSGWKRLRLLIFIVVTSMSVIACRTNTAFDAMVYPSEPYWEAIRDDPDGLLLCQWMERQGFTFDTFYVDESGVQVTYPDGHIARFQQDRSVTPLVLKAISRDFDGFAALAEGEEERLHEEAETFCQEYEQAATDLGVDLPLDGVFFWDYVVGMRIGFYFSDAGCEITGSYGLSAGSYARDYELDPEAICPSGRVVQ